MRTFLVTLLVSLISLLHSTAAVEDAKDGNGFLVTFDVPPAIEKPVLGEKPVRQTEENNDESEQAMDTRQVEEEGIQPDEAKQQGEPSINLPPFFEVGRIEVPVRDENNGHVRDLLNGKNGVNDTPTMATTMVTDTDFLGNLITTPSTFPLEPQRRAFQSCIFGCSSVTVPAPTESGGSTVIVVLPLTIPCSLVVCPPCTSCVSSTVSITVCPVVKTVTPTAATATIFTTASSIGTEKCMSMIYAAIADVTSSLASPVTFVVTVTKTRIPVSCPTGAAVFEDSEDGALTRTMEGHSVCSTFVVCRAKKFTCPATLSLTGSIHILDTLQALLPFSTASSVTSVMSGATSTMEGTSSILEISGSSPSVEQSSEQTTTEQLSVTSMIVHRMFQKNQGSSLTFQTLAILPLVITITLLLMAA